MVNEELKMIEKELRAYRIYKQCIQILVNFTGCSYMPTKHSKPRSFWSVIVMLLLMSFVLLDLYLCSKLLKHDLIKMMHFFALGISLFGSSLKVLSVLINRNFIYNYHQMLDDLYKEEIARNDIIRTIMLSSLRKIYILGYMYYAFEAGIYLSYFIPPCSIILRDLIHFRLTTNYALPCKALYFWTVPDNFWYHFHLLYEMSATFFSCTVASCIDTIFGFWIYQIASTMDAITFTLINPPPTEKYSNVIKMCVIKHQKLIQCCDMLGHIYGKIIFWHILSNAVLLCALMFEASTYTEITFSKVSMFVTFAGIKLLQSFIYAWHGTILTNAGENFRMGIYFGKWLNSNLDGHMRTDIVMMLMQKPLNVNAVFSPVDIAMFTNLINTTISYFFLVRSVNDKGN